MTNDATELPVFPTSAPAVFHDPAAVSALFGDVLDRLAEVADISGFPVDAPTPCDGLALGALHQHVLGWLGFFAASLSDPDAANGRPDPASFALPAETSASDVVEDALSTIRAAVDADVAAQLVTMSSSRMQGSGVLGMALGEYIIHAWDLAVSTGRSYIAPEAALAPAHDFLLGMVQPEYRGPDTGFFDAEFTVPDDAPPLDRLLAFAGRNPQWTPSNPT